MHSSQTNPVVRSASGLGTPAKKSRSMVPPLWLWIVLALALVAGIVLQTTEVLADRAITNLICEALGFLVALIVLVWFLFLSGFPVIVRLATAVSLVAALVILLQFFRIGFTGDMELDIEWRRKSELPTASGEPADLASTTPQDFWQFLGPNRNAGVDSVTLKRDWSASPPKLLWKQPIGSGWSAFAVVNGFAVTLEQHDDQELVTCYEVQTGKLRWSHKHQARYDDFMGGVGPRSTPTIHHGKVYALGATGVLFCLEGATGKELWKKDLLQEFGISPSEEAANLKFGRANSPLIVKDLVVLPAGGPTKDQCVSLVAYHKDTGAKVWAGGKQQIGYSSPALAKLAGVEQILIVNESSVSGHDPDTGKELWQFKWKGNSSQDANSSQAVPVDGGRVFVSKGYNQGSALYRFEPASDGKLSAEKIWHNREALLTKFTNVSIKNRFVYGLSEGTLECVELDTGAIRWSDGYYGHGQILRVGDLLLVMSEKRGEVALVEASPDRANNVLGTLKALDGKTWNNIALYGPYLLVRNGQEAACYQLPVAD